MGFPERAWRLLIPSSSDRIPLARTIVGLELGLILLLPWLAVLLRKMGVNGG